MFKALMGGGRSSSDVRSSTSSSSKSGSRRKSSHGHRSSASSTVSRKSSSRGDDRDRGLGDLSAYPAAGSRSRSVRYAESAAGESVASSYATARPNNDSVDHVYIEREPKRRESEYNEREGRERDSHRYRDDRDRDRDRDTDYERDRRKARPDREHSGERDRDSRRRERERERAYPGDNYYPPVASGAVPAPFDPVQATQGPPFPTNPVSVPPAAPAAPTPTIYDPHVQQQFPGQFPTSYAEPYRPPNPAGEAADYYNDQGQSVQEQPGVRPKPPLVIPNSQAHLMTASPTANPPPEPSSLGEVGAAASYFANDPALDIENSGHSTSGPESRPPKPSNPSQPPHHAAQAAGAMGAAAAAATYGVGSYSPEHVLTESPAAYVPPTSTNDNKPPHTQPHSHGVGTALGGAAAGAAAGYMLGHHHHSSSSSDHISQYTMQNPDDVSQIGPGYSSAPFNPTLYTAGAAGAAGAAYAASPLHPHHAAIYHGSPFQGGVMAFQQRQRGPLDKFIDFWRDPEGVGKFEDYTEAIGVCKYCFEPGTTSRDAPRTHHYRRRRSSDRLTGGSRVGKLSRYASSEDEGRRRKSKSSWLAAILGGYVAKSLFDSKDFDDSYSVKSGRVAGAFPESDSTSDMRSKTSRGVYKQLHRSHSRDRIGYRDQRPSRYEGSRINGRFRSRSRSSSRTNRHTLRDAAIGAAIGTAAASAVKSRGERSPSRSRSPSPHKTRGRKSSSSSGSSYENISQPAKKIAGGFGSFFTASSENRSKKRRNKRSKSIFSFYNSSSSSVDNDLAFGSGYARKLIGKSKRRSSKEKKEKDVDAKLLALGATATALAASSPRRSRRAGEVFVGQGSRSGRSDYTSSGSNDDDWEDLDSEGQASSVSSALAFGASGHFAREDSHSSDSSSPGWGWGWGTKSKKKTKNKSKRRSSSPKDRFHAGPATAVVAGALGTAALASGYHRGDKESSTSSASLQHVAPVPTSDPARYDAIPISSFPPSEPQLVRPGAIPLQQPQPVTPVSQAVYTSQGAPIPPFTAPIIPTSENPFPSYESQSRDADRKSSGYVERPSDVSVPKSHKRSESTPVIRSDPVQSVAEPVLGIKRRSTAKDQASVVQFDLTREQEDRERRAEHLERLRRDLGRGDRIELIDREGDSQSAPGEYGLQSGGEPDWVHEREREREREYLYERERRREREREQERERDYVPDSAGPIVSGAIGAAAASTIFSEGSSKDDVSDRSERRRERREQRRAERRQANGSSAVSSVVEEPRKGPDELPEHPEPRELMEERASSTSPSNNHVKTSAFRNVSRRKSVYDDYATFFYPEELRHSPDSHSRQGTPTMPTIVEIVPASERAEPPPPNPNADYEPPIDFKDFDRLPWPVPVLKVTGPTPPHSSSGSVRSAPSPVITPSEPAEGEKESERPNASRVSWGEHQTHEYEVPSTSSERSSVDLHEQQHDFPPKTSAHDDDMGYSYIAPSDAHVEDVNEDIQFAATVAAAAQAAGFDPALVTEDPIFRTRTSPPGSQTRERSISPTTIVSVTASHEPPAPQQFRGFVEGEVDSPSAPKSQFFSDPSTVIFDRPSPFENQPEWTWATDRPTTLDQPVVERVNKVETETGGIAKDVSRSVMGTRETQGGPFAERRQEPESPGEEEWFMPGGFEPEESKIERRSTSPTAGVPQSVPEEKEPEAGPEALKRTETKDTDDSNDSPEAAIGAENEGEGKKKKRRKRRSKGSDALDEPASFTSSVLTESSDKRKSTDDKSKKSGGFLASLFGSRVSEPVDSKGSRSTDKLVSREVQSEIGPATSEASPHRHTHRHRSSIDSRDPSRTDYDRDRHREFELHRAESFPVEGSRVSEPTTHKRSNSIDRLVSRDVQSEIGTRRSGNADSPRRRRHHHRTSSGGDSLDGRRKFDDPGLDKDGDGDGDDADKENVNLESYKSSRQRREERRRQRFGNGDGNGDGYEKEPTSRTSLDSERDQSFLVERPEMPVSPLDTGEPEPEPELEHEYEYGGTSGPILSSLNPAEGAGGESGLGIISRRPRSHSTTPPSSEKIVPDSGFRSISPGPRRPSLSRFADSPTAVPLHFRPPPASPRSQRSPSVTSPPGSSPVSPSQQGRRSRPNSLEFKSSREIRPLYLVERLGSSKIDQAQFGDEPLPSLPSSKSASTEDLTALRDENAWEVQPVSIEQHHDILGSQQNTPTGATFGSGIPRHLSRKEELGYEFHSPSELLQDAELSSYLDLPESQKADVSLPQGSVVGVKTDPENLPPLPDSRPSSPDDKDDFVSVSDTQMATPKQGAETEKGLASANRDIPGLELYNGIKFTGSVDPAIAASPSSSSTPYPDTKLLAESKPESHEAEVEGQDDDARTVTGNDVPTLVDLSPSHSPITDKERDHIHPTSWGFASVVGATIAATANADNAVPGDYSATMPSETDKPAESVADTTEDEFFDAMSRDEAADHNMEERAWETDLPSGMETPRNVESGLYELIAAGDVSVRGSEDVEKGSGLNAEFGDEHEPQLKREVEPEVEILEADESKQTAEPLRAPGPPPDDTKAPEPEPTVEPAPQPQPETIELDAASISKNEHMEPTAGPTNKAVEEPVFVAEANPAEAQSKEQEPDAPPSSKKNKKKKKERGKSLDSSNQDEESLLDTAADTAAPGPAPSLEDADANVLSAQAPVTVIDQPTEEVHATISAPETSVLEEAEPYHEHATSEVHAAGGAESLHVEDTPGPVTEQTSALEKEPSFMEAAPEIVPKEIELGKAMEPVSTQAEVPQEVLTGTGLSKKAKKKKKKAAKSTDQTQDASVESASALDQLSKGAQESIVDKEPGAPETGAVVVFEKPVEEPAVSTEDVSSGCGLAESSEPVEPRCVAEQPAEALQPHIPDLEAQNSFPSADSAARPIEAEAETAHESNQAKQEEKDELPQAQAENIPLSRKASKKNKKKNKRKSTAEAEPQPEAAGASPETSEKAGPDPEASVLGDEKCNLEGQEVNSRDDMDNLTDAVEDEKAPNAEPETKPEDAATPLETSGQVPLHDDNKQVPAAGTEQQATDAQSVDTTPVAIQDETVPSHLVGISETNDDQPHMPEQATIEPDSGEPSSTGEKSKKNRKKKQSVSSVFEEALSSNVAGASGIDIQDATPATESTPDVPVETDALAGYEELPAAITQNPVEKKSRDVELPAEADGALSEVQTATEAAPMTDAQWKAKKDKRKKPQSLASDEPEPEAQAYESVAEKKLIDVPVQDDKQTPEIPEPEVEQTEVITPAIEHTALENPVDEAKEIPEQADEQVAEKIGEETGDEAPAKGFPSVVGEPITTKAAEPVLGPSQDRATDLAIEQLDTTKTQSTLELQEDKAAERETHAVTEQPTEPAPQDASPLGDNTTVTEPTEDNQPTTSKNAKKKKKKKRQSISVDENGAEASPKATPTKEEDTTENSAERADPSNQDISTEPALEKAVEQGELDEIQTEAAATTDEIQEAERLEGLSVPAEVTPETPVEQESIRDSAAPKMLKETTTDETSVAQHEDTVLTTEEPEMTKLSLPEESTPDLAQSQEHQQSSEPAEEKQTSSSKKKNKKKKKKSLSSTSVDEGPRTAPQDPVGEQEVVEPQAITEASLTAEPEKVAPDTAAAVEESLPPAPESAESEPDPKEPTSQHPPQSTNDTNITVEPREVATSTQETPPSVLESAELEGKEPESQDVPLTDEQQAKALKKKAKKDKKKRKSVLFAAEESLEQQAEPSDSPERTEPAVDDSIEAIEAVKNDAPVEREALPEQLTASPEPVPGNESVLEQNEQQILGEPTLNDFPLNDDREVSAVQASEDLLKDGPDTPKTEEPISASQLEQVEPKAMELTAETTIPETGLSKTDKKRAKKEKKRQSKLLALENDNVQSTSTEHALDPEVPANEVAPETNELKSDAPAETAFSPAEEDGKDNQSHDTESRGGTDKELTWTDNDVSSQVEKEKQHTAFPDLIPEREPERTEIDKGAVEAEPAPTTADIEVVEESQKETGFVPSGDAILEEQDVSHSEVATDLREEEVQSESEQKKNSEAADTLKKADQEEVKPTTSEALEAVEERLEEVVPKPITGAEPAKEVEPTQSVENVAGVKSETEPAVPLSKKQKKKQRQADNAAASQERVKETASTEGASNPLDLTTEDEAKVDRFVFEAVEDETRITEESTLHEAYTEATTREILEHADFATTDHQLVEPAFPETVEDTTVVLEEAARPESSWVIVDESKPDAELRKFDEQPVDTALSGPVHDITTTPAPEENLQQAETREVHSVKPEFIVTGPETEQDKSWEASAVTNQGNEPVTNAALLIDNEGIAEETIAKDDMSVVEDKPDEPTTGKSMKNIMNMEKAPSQVTDVDNAYSSKGDPVTAAEPAVQTEGIGESSKNRAPGPTPFEPAEQKEQPKTDSAIELGILQIEGPVPAPLVKGEFEEQLEVVPQVEEKAPQVEAPDTVLLKATSAIEQPETPLGDLSKVGSREEPPAALEESNLTRKVSKKKKKKAKKQTKEQEQLEREVIVSASSETKVREDLKAAVEAEAVSAAEPVESVDVQHGSTDEATNVPAEGDERPDMTPKKPVQGNVIREEREEVPEDTEKKLDVPREDIQEKVTVEFGKEALLEKRMPEQELQTDSVEAVAEKERVAATAEESRASEPESAPAPLTRKMSKREKKNLKKQAEKQERKIPVQTMEAVKDDFSVPQAAVQVPGEKKEQQMLTERVEVLKEKVLIPGPALEPETTEEAKAEYLGESVSDRISAQPTMESMKPTTEPFEEEGIPLSWKPFEMERKKRKDNVEEPQLEDQQEEQASQPGNQTSHKPPEPAEAQETAREDEDAWPAIDWAKGKIDATDQSAQSSPEAHAAPFVPEIPEFKESAIPEALIERVSGNPEEAAKEGKAQAMTGTIERDVTTSEFKTTGADSALRVLHHVESTQGKKAEEPKTAVPVSDKIASIFPNLERGFFRRPSPTQSVKDGAEEETVEEASRDSAIQVLEAPIAKEAKLQPEIRDSGYIPSPADDVVGAVSRELPAKIQASVPPENFEHESRQDTTPEPAQGDDVFGIATRRELPASKTDPDLERPIKDPQEEPRSIADTISESGSTCELRRSPSIHGRHVPQRLPWSLEESAQARRERDISPSPLPPIAEQEHERAMVRDVTPRLEMKPEHVLPRPETPVRKFTENALGRRAWPTPENESDDDWEKVQKPSPKNLSPERGLRPGILKTPEQDKPVLRPSRPPSAKSSTHSLRRIVHSASGDLRAAALAANDAAEEPAPDNANQSQAAIPQPPAQAPTDLDVGEIASSSSYDPVTDKGKRPLRSMTDIYEGWGETPSSPRSPSRPASIRHRRSMQHLQELEFRLEHLLQENRDLAAARDAAEDKLRNASFARRKSDQALNTRDADLRDREAELERLQQSVEWFQKEVARLNEENAGLTSKNAALIVTHTQELQTLQQTSAREIEQLRSQNDRLSVDLHERIKSEIETALLQKNAELRRLREELESARDKVKELQQQISAEMNDNVIAFRGEDYFEAACQKLCGHVQQWVLRFSKHSDHRRCRRLIEIKDEKIADRFDNAILDGSDTDTYLADRVRRRDVFMSVVMTMVWEFVFTRYLFGMDREQRQKLKSLEKQLIEVGPRKAIHRWRATTLTLLSRRQAFAKQRDSDTEAVALEIFDTLSRLLPPPTTVESQLLDSLRKVLRVAVSLSIEMRTQLAEYIMLPPLQPEYDTNGDLARQVFFNASLMNERSGETTSNEELQAQNAVVRVVLFPLVVKKGNDAGEGEDEVVVCPAQVLVARPGKDKRLNRMTSGDRMSIDASRSVHSIAPSSMNMSMSNVI